MLDKKVRKNPKYENIKSTLNTGKTMKEVEIISKLWLIELLGDKLVAKKKNEKFKRIKCSTLAKMLQEPPSEESIFNLAGQKEPLSAVL